MRNADQSTFDVDATVPAAALHCTMTSRNAASAAASMVPVNTITPSASCAAKPFVFHRREPDASRGDLTDARADRTLRVGHAHDAFRTQDLHDNAFGHVCKRALSNTSGTATVTLADAGIAA